MQSRSGRMPRTNNGQSTAKTTSGDHAIPQPSQAPDQQNQHQRRQDSTSKLHYSSNAFNRLSSAASRNGNLNGDGEGSHDGPPIKRRKLSIRSKHTQQNTLDNYAFAPSTVPRPPTKVAVSQPHGQVFESINGVRTALDTPADKLLNTENKSRRVPQRVTRSPAPGPPQKQEDKRSLRSHDDGPRLKSELAIYFPQYEEIIFDAPKDNEFLTVDTVLYVMDDASKQAQPEDSSPAKSSKNSKTSPKHGRQTSINGNLPPAMPKRSSTNQFNGSPSLNFDFVSKTIPDNPDDPLEDVHFFVAHRRAERKEKQLRNIERERAMHEKVQLERLLDSLQGHDWLRVLGITGITDGEAKKYEPKRDYFIGEVKALVDKFKLWKEQEKKQRVEKETVVTFKEVEEEDGYSESSMDAPSSDLNASAAWQLQQETFNALKSTSQKPAGKGKELVDSAPSRPSPMSPGTPSRRAPIVPAPPSPETPITSFYAKRHLRDAALGKSRHGRNITAFGHPLPEMEQRNFKLPSEYITEDTLKAKARERRRRKRETAAKTSGSN